MEITNKDMVTTGAHTRPQTRDQKFIKGPVSWGRPPGIQFAHSDEADHSVRSDADQCGAKRRRALL